jgi:hypothetical protein
MRLQAVLAQMVAVVRPEHDIGIPKLPRAGEGVDDAAHGAVHVLDAPEPVAVDLGEGLTLHGIHAVEPLHPLGLI